jgi:hypothetical protein
MLWNRTSTSRRWRSITPNTIGQVSELRQAFQRGVGIVHVGLMVFGVMDLHRLLTAYAALTLEPLDNNGDDYELYPAIPAVRLRCSGRSPSSACRSAVPEHRKRTAGMAGYSS